MHPSKLIPTRFKVLDHSQDPKMFPNLIISIEDLNVRWTEQRRCTETPSRENRLRRFETSVGNCDSSKRKNAHKKCERSSQSYRRSGTWSRVSNLRRKKKDNSNLLRTSTKNSKRVVDSRRSVVTGLKVPHVYGVRERTKAGKADATNYRQQEGWERKAVYWNYERRKG